MKNKNKNLLNYRININNYFLILIEICKIHNNKMQEEKLYIQYNHKKIQHVNHQNIHQIKNLINNNNHNNKINKVLEEKYKEN